MPRMPGLGPDGKPGVWRTRGGAVVFVPFESRDQSGAVLPDVLGVALASAQAGESVWVSFQTPGSVPGSRVLVLAEEMVVAGAPVVQGRTGPTAVRPVSAGEAKMPVSVQASGRVLLTNTMTMGFPEETAVASVPAWLRATAPSARGLGALVARVGEEGAALLERGEPFTVASRRWLGILFRVKKDGSVSAVRMVREDGRPAVLTDVAAAPAPTYLGNGGPPPWPEVVLGRLLALEADETLLFGTGELGGVMPVTRRMRLGEA